MITLASKLSGTYQSVVIAAAEYENIYIVDSKHLWEQGLKEVRYTCIGSIIGTHAGPGAVAVAFFKKPC